MPSYYQLTSDGEMLGFAGQVETWVWNKRIFEVKKNDDGPTSYIISEFVDD